MLCTLFALITRTGACKTSSVQNTQPSSSGCSAIRHRTSTQIKRMRGQKFFASVPSGLHLNFHLVIQYHLSFPETLPCNADCKNMLFASSYWRRSALTFSPSSTQHSESTAPYQKRAKKLLNSLFFKDYRRVLHQRLPAWSCGADRGTLQGITKTETW